MTTPRARRFERIPAGDARLAAGARLFNAGRFFEAHEAWESLWQEVGGKERNLLQGLIQLAAAYHHRGRGNRAGARRLYATGRAHVAAWGACYAGLRLEDFLTQVDADFAAMAGGAASTEQPQLRMVDKPA